MQHASNTEQQCQRGAQPKDPTIKLQHLYIHAIISVKKAILLLFTGATARPLYKKSNEPKLKH